MGFFDGIDGYVPYEDGGVAGAASGAPVQTTPGQSGPEMAPPMMMNSAAASPSGAAAGGVPANLANPFLLGFDTSKLYDPSSGGAAGSKYTDAAKAFGQAYLGGGANISRGNLGAMLSSVQQQFPNAKAVGDDKIDFGDGNGPIDVIGSDGSVRFQNTTDNAQWQAQHPGQPAGLGPQMQDGGGMFAGGGSGGGGGYGGGGSGGGAPGGWNGQQYTAATLSAPNPYAPQAVGNQPGVTANQVTGPQALTADQLAQMPAFKAPTAAEAANDPGYQFALQQGNAALGNKYAASGLRGAGQAQGFADYNQNAASQQYDKVYSRALGEQQNAFTQAFQTTGANNAANAQAYGLTNQYQQGAQIANQGANLNAAQFNAGQNQQNSQFNAGRQDTAAQNNFTNAFNVGQANNQNAQAAWQGNTNAQLGQGNLNLGYTNAANNYGLGMANVGLGYHQADQSYALGQGNLALGYQNSNNAAAANAGQLGLGWANYGLGQQGQDFNQGLALSQIGLQAAGQYGNYAGQYGQNAGNYATGAANANAAATNASGQAWGQAFNGAAAGAAGAAGLYYGNQRPLTSTPTTYYQ